jgi:hypothetical protein
VTRSIVTYAEGAHEELLDVAMPTFKEFAHRHGYHICCFAKSTDWPPAWNKVHHLLAALGMYDEVVWFDCDLVIVNPTDNFPEMHNLHSLVRHFEGKSEVPNSGVWRLRRGCEELLQGMLKLEVFKEHGWWEQAALLTLMGYAVPPEWMDFRENRCRCVQQTSWYKACQFMRLEWNSHPNFRVDNPRIVHCSYPDMPRRLNVMRSLVKDPHYNYPEYEVEDAVERSDA